MKKFWKNNSRIIFLIALIIITWRGILFVAGNLGKYTIPERQDFLGPIPWANFDGVHYLTIAQVGYGNNTQAFFPLFPLLTHTTSIFFGGNSLVSSLFVVHISLIIALILLWKLVALDYGSSVVRWSLLFFLFFPTSFFFGSIYTESLFVALVLGSFYAARKQHWFLAGLLGFFASTARIVGVALLPALLWELWLTKRGQQKVKKSSEFFWLLLIPAGLFSYMFYQYMRFHDALAFIHIQPGFGAQRTGGEIILLPQVIFRYIKIFLTVPWVEQDARIAALEFFMLTFVGGLLALSWKNIRKSYLIFSLLVILIPTLTGTLSSMPRYVLAAFPLFIILALIKSTLLKLLLAISFLLLLVILTMFFTSGYFVA